MTNAIEILLVEDTPSDVFLTEEVLRNATFKYFLNVKKDGVDALDYLKEAKNSPAGKLPDIVLLDLNMPRMNGRELLAEISNDAVLRDIPVVLLTVSEREEDIIDALRSKMNYYVVKPLTGDKLPILINTILELQRQECTQEKAYSDEEIHIRLVLAGNPHTSEIAMQKLSEDPNERVRSRLAENPRLALEIVLKLVTDPSDEVRSSLGENPNLPFEVFELLARDASDDVRLALSANSLLPAHLLEALAKDDNMFVASSAQKTLQNIKEDVIVR